MRCAERGLRDGDWAGRKHRGVALNVALEHSGDLWCVIGHHHLTRTRSAGRQLRACSHCGRSGEPHNSRAPAINVPQRGQTLTRSKSISSPSAALCGCAVNYPLPSSSTRRPTNKSALRCTQLSSRIPTHKHTHRISTAHHYKSLRSSENTGQRALRRPTHAMPLWCSRNSLAPAVRHTNTHRCSRQSTLHNAEAKTNRTVSSTAGCSRSTNGGGG